MPRSPLFAVLLATLSAPLLLTVRAQAQVQNQTGNAMHTDGTPTIIEGPQTAGNAPARPAEPVLMSNDSVVRMHAAGLSDDLILQTVSSQPGSYTTSPDDLIQLKQKGLSDAVIAAMVNHARRSLSHPEAAPVAISVVDEIGVYYKDARGAWIPMESEAVHIKSGGFLKHTLSNGIVKEDRNGVVAGRESRLLLPRPIEFLIYTPDGVEGSEYDLLRFRLNSKDREFRTLTGGIIHSTGGAQRDEEPFSPKRIAPHTYTFTLPRTASGGEYGILPPGTGNVTNGGKIYTFAISE